MTRTTEQAAAVIAKLLKKVTVHGRPLLIISMIRKFLLVLNYRWRSEGFLGGTIFAQLLLKILRCLTYNTFA
ncbi:hypothetical protein H5410_043028 [Solanum commersonii]|uniref:Uncharacterized protein n=1 Tax=Solanum commersonii TaxID=4109 RepID=A0A9J5XXP2_SOLCO|nr:hypothetical protein H5410_043028 [Solanum commersonii]